MSKVFKDTTILDYKGEPIKILMPNEPEPKELTLKQMLWLILNNAPLQTQQDSINGASLASALDAAKDGTDIVIEDGVYIWLKPVAEKVTPSIFKINGHIVYEHIKEGFEKPHQPKNKLD